jgi:two-component system invasion response regulator UvrY
MQKKLLLACRHTIERQGLAALLESEGGVMVVGQTGTCGEAIRLCCQLRPDITLLELGLCEGGITKSVHALLDDCAGVKIIGLASYAAKPHVIEFLKAGASGCLLKDCDIDELMEAIDVVYDGGMHLCPRTASLLVDEFQRPQGEDQDQSWLDLTYREKEVLNLILVAKDIKEIAAELDLSPNTVYVHKRRIMKKLNVKNSMELTKIAIRDGMMPGG